MRAPRRNLEQSIAQILTRSAFQPRSGAQTHLQPPRLLNPVPFYYSPLWLWGSQKRFSHALPSFLPFILSKIRKWLSLFLGFGSSCHPGHPSPLACWRLGGGGLSVSAGSAQREATGGDGEAGTVNSRVEKGEGDRGALPGS